MIATGTPRHALAHRNFVSSMVFHSSRHQQCGPPTLRKRSTSYCQVRTTVHHTPPFTRPLFTRDPQDPSWADGVHARPAARDSVAARAWACGDGRPTQARAVIMLLLIIPCNITRLQSQQCQRCLFAVTGCPQLAPPGRSSGDAEESTKPPQRSVVDCAIAYTSTYTAPGCVVHVHSLYAEHTTLLHDCVATLGPATPHAWHLC